MPDERRRFLSDHEIARNYKINRNSVWSSYQEHFRILFEDFNGVPKKPYQANWYVGTRWDRQTRGLVTSPYAEERLLSFLRDESQGSRRCLRLIYGGIGSGKTTFILYFFNVYLPQNDPTLDRRLAPIVIDCADAAVSPDSLEQDVDHRISDYLDKRYPWLEESPHFLDMWESECRFDRLFYIRLWSQLGPAETEAEKLKIIEPKRRNYHDYNRVRINYLVSKGYLPIMVWDNLDHAGLDVQRAAIQLARHKLSWMSGAKVVICVRENTCPLVQQEIAPAAYRISDQELFPPDVHTVLDRRREAAVEQLSPSVLPSVAVTDKFSFAASRPADFLRAVLECLKCRDIEDALCSLSVDNVRVQLAMAERTLKSGHIPDELIADIVRAYVLREGRGQLSWRRFMLGLICGEYLYFREEGEDQALVVNLFEAGNLTHGFCNSLCLPRILGIVEAFGDDVALSEVIQCMVTVGYPELTVRKGILTLMKAVLIRSLQGRLPDDFVTGGAVQSPFYVSCTPAGRYYMKRLVRELVYVEHMSLVTSMESRFRALIKRWEPGDIELAVASAVSLIAQVHIDEKREGEQARTSPDAFKIHQQFQFGHLAHDMATGCGKAVYFIKSTWEKDKREEARKIDWVKLQSLLTAPPIVELEIKGSRIE